MADVTSLTLVIDGDPDAIAGHSTYYAQIAESVATSITKLRTVTDGLVTTSDAVAAFAEVANEAATNLVEVDERYRNIADQLAVYAAALRDLKVSAGMTQSAAHGEARDRTTAIHQRHEAWNDYLAADPQGPDRVTYHQLYVAHDRTVDELVASIAARQRDFDQLIEDWRSKANACADAIYAVVNGSSLNDSWWDSFVSWMEGVLPTLELILDIVSIVLTVVAFILVLTGVGAPIAAALFAIARIVQLVSKALTIIRLVVTVVEVARGKKSPTALIAFAVEAAIDKLGGKLLPGAAKKALAKHGDDLVDALKAVNLNKLSKGTAKLVNKGFDDWADDVLEPFIDKGLKNSPIAEGLTHFSDGIVKTWSDGLEAVADGTANATLSALIGQPVNIGGFGSDATGLAGEVSGLAWDGLKLVNDSAGAVGLPHFDIGGAIEQLGEPGPHPSYESLVDHS